MRTILIVCVFFTVCLLTHGQPIYRGLNYGMNVKDAKTEFKTNKDLYDNVDFGNGFVWCLYFKNVIFINDSLVAGVFIPKGSGFGISNDGCTSYLEFSRAFFEVKKYDLFYEPDSWQYATLFRAKYGLLLSNPEKTIMVQIFPGINYYGGSNFYQPMLKIMNYKWFMSTYEADHKLLNKKIDESGF